MHSLCTTFEERWNMFMNGFTLHLCLLWEKRNQKCCLRVLTYDHHTLGSTVVHHTTHVYQIFPRAPTYDHRHHSFGTTVVHHHDFHQCLVEKFLSIARMDMYLRKLNRTFRCRLIVTILQAPTLGHHILDTILTHVYHYHLRLFLLRLRCHYLLVAIKTLLSLVLDSAYLP